MKAKFLALVGFALSALTVTAVAAAKVAMVTTTGITGGFCPLCRFNN